MTFQSYLIWENMLYDFRHFYFLVNPSFQKHDHKLLLYFFLQWKMRYVNYDISLKAKEINLITSFFKNILF